MLISLGSQPNKEISALIRERGSFFAGDRWQQHLQQSLRAHSLYFHDSERDDGMVVQVFQRGPFRVGYLNFPIGGTIRQLEPGMDAIQVLTGYLRQYAIHRLRVRKSAFRADGVLSGKPVVEPETAVTDVGHYDCQNIAKIRRDLNRAQRFGITILDKPSVSPKYLFDTYATTVNRHSGELRYSQHYFSSLADLNETQKNLRILLAGQDGQPVGFLVLIIEADTAYYLHGGVSTGARKYGVSDVLVDHALSISQDHGVSLFNLMTSPSSQPSLVKFKEKWGGETRQHETYDFPVNRFWDQTLKVVEKIYRETSRLRN